MTDQTRKPADHLSQGSSEQKQKILDMYDSLEKELLSIGITPVNDDIAKVTAHLAEELGAKTSEQVTNEILEDTDLIGTFEDAFFGEDDDADLNRDDINENEPPPVEKDDEPVGSIIMDDDINIY